MTKKKKKKKKKKEKMNQITRLICRKYSNKGLYTSYTNRLLSKEKKKRAIKRKNFRKTLS